MLYLSNFARPQGAKDKEPRKKRGTLGNLAIGTGVGALGGLGAGKVITNNKSNELFFDQAKKTGFSGNKKELIEIFNKAAKEDTTGEGVKLIKKAKGNVFKAIAPRTIATGAGVGLLGTGAYLGGRAVINKLRNKNVSNRKG